jgi:hypothetical protein
MYTISLITDNSDYGKAVNTLFSGSEAQQFTDPNGWFSKRIQSTWNDIKVQIDITPIHDLHSLRSKTMHKLDEDYQLVVIFNECSAINPRYKTGDLVIHGFNAAHPVASLPKEENIKALAATLPKLSCEGYNIEVDAQKILATLSTAPSSCRELKAKLNYQDEHWITIFENLIKPMIEEGFLTRNDEYILSITPKGSEKLKTLPDPKVSQQASIHFGEALTELGMYTVSSSSSSPIPTTCSVQDMYHKAIDGIVKDTRQCKAKKILHVSSVKCKSGEDREFPNGYEKSVAQTFKKFLEGFVQIK